MIEHHTPRQDGAQMIAVNSINGHEWHLMRDGSVRVWSSQQCYLGTSTVAIWCLIYGRPEVWGDMHLTSAGRELVNAETGQ